MSVLGELRIARRRSMASKPSLQVSSSSCHSVGMEMSLCWSTHVCDRRDCGILDRGLRN